MSPRTESAPQIKRLGSFTFVCTTVDRQVQMRQQRQLPEVVLTAFGLDQQSCSWRPVSLALGGTAVNYLL